MKIKKMYRILSLLLIMIACIYTSSYAVSKPIKIVPIEIVGKTDGDNDGSVGAITYQGVTYKVVRVDGKWCMAENLRAEKYRDGTPIPNLKSFASWQNTGTGAWCDYNNDTGFSKKYGHLYNWHAVNGDIDNDPEKEKELAPPGWHLLTYNEWDGLIKDGNKRGWPVGKLQNGIQYAGYRRVDGSFYSIEKEGGFWTTDEFTAAQAQSAGFYWKKGHAGILSYEAADCADSYAREKNMGCSVRCVKDEL